MRRRDLLSGAFVLGTTFLTGCGTAGGTRTLLLPPDVTRAVDAEIEKQMAADNLPGVAVGIWIPGRGEYVTAKGKANLETGLARDTTSPFRIASITKTFTATAILQLVDEGKLSTTDKLSKWYPAFPKADSITVDHLLRMRSGIPDSLDTAFLAEYNANPTGDFTAEEMINRSASRAFEFQPPDQKTVYNNVNYVLLQEIIRKVSGQDIQTRISEKILKPLGMNRTIYPTSSAFPGPVHGYLWDPATSRFVDRTIINPAPAGGAGAMISTLADLQVYARALATGTLLRPETHRSRLQTQNIAGDPEFVRYGQGIIQIGKFYGHNGTIFGFSSEMFYLPEKDAVIVINVNRLDLDDHSRSSTLFFLLARLLFPNDVNW